jgi:hypothetical protein
MDEQLPLFSAWPIVAATIGFLLRHNRIPYPARSSVSHRNGKNMATPKLELILAYVFGVIFTAALLGLMVFNPHPSLEQFEVFRIVIAVAVAGIAAMIPGLLKLKLSQGSKLALQAGGALAVFVIVYFYSPSRWAVSPPSSTTTAAQIAPFGNAAGVNNGSQTTNNFVTSARGRVQCPSNSEAEANIRWVGQDSGAHGNYLAARAAHYSIMSALLRAQHNGRGNPGLTINRYGVDCAEQFANDNGLN